MESLEQILARLASSEGAQTEGRGQGFTLDPTKVREALAGLVKADPLLWFKHLLQWLHDLPQERAAQLLEQPQGDLLLAISAEKSLHAELTLERIQAAHAELLAPGRANEMARILVELGPTAQYYHERDAGTALCSQADGPRFEPSKSRVTSGIGLLFSFRSLSSVPNLFGQGQRQAIAELEALSGLHPQPPELVSGPPIVADWPFPPPSGDEDDRLKLWDWETVIPAQQGGFRWSVAAWSEVLAEVTADNEPFTIVRHPLIVKRAFSEHPLVGCYPACVTGKLDLSDRPSLSHLNLKVERVFGVSWTVSAPKKSVVIPVIRGVPGGEIPLENTPPGIFILAEASHLRTDATGLALVDDEATQRWKAELIRWAYSQGELYLPYLSEIPSIWMKRAHRWRDTQRPPGPLMRILKYTFSGVFSLPPMRKLLSGREKQLRDWLARRDSSNPSSNPKG